MEYYKQCNTCNSTMSFYQASHLVECTNPNCENIFIDRTYTPEIHYNN